MITGISTYAIPNEREYFSLSSFFFYVILRITYKSKKHFDENLFFHFYFSNVHISVNNKFENLRLGIQVANIHVEGTLSQIFYFRPSFYLM